MKVLIAEDVSSTRLFLESVIRGMGHAVISTVDGRAAWEVFQRERPPLVVLDWMMPEMDGLEVCRRIRAAEDTRDTFVLLQTARDRAEHLSTALDAGVDDYITKPVTAEHLRARLTIAELRITQQSARKGTEAALARARWLAGIGETALAVERDVSVPLQTILETTASGLEKRSAHDLRQSLAIVATESQRIADTIRRLADRRTPFVAEPPSGGRLLRQSDLGRPLT